MNTSSKPYHDDYDARKNFVKVLFKPGPAVQARELTQLQTLLQEQVRRFGDNVLKNGTIVSGGQITHHPSLPYVKIKDLDNIGKSVHAASLFNYHVRNAYGTKAIIVTAISGQEATPPNLKTIYVKYLNAGTNGNVFNFSADEILTVSDPITNEDIMQITVAGALASPIGVGYGLTVDEGVIYHAGYFTRIDKQLAIVSKYDVNADQLAVGFDTTFEIVTADDDASLYDNALGSPNANAPGADRLKANASIIVLTKAEAAQRPNFLSIVEFTAGEPYKQEPNTQYNVIEQNIARRAFEESGNYVIDRFNLNTKSGPLVSEPSKTQIVIDPGVAYINGYRVATERNYTQDISKAIATKTSAGVSTSVDYGNYIEVDRFDGDVANLIGSVVDFRDAVQTYQIGGNPVYAGAVIGSARIRGIKMTSRGRTLKARIYVFDVQMSGGQPFENVKSITRPTGGSFSANVTTARIFEGNRSASIFGGPAAAIKSISNVSFVQQKSDWGTLSTNTSGDLSIAVTGTDQFEYTGTLTRSVLDDMIIVPVANVVSTVTQTGTVSITNGQTAVTGSGTSFPDTLAGQFIQVGNTVVQIASVANTTSASLATASTVSDSGSWKFFYPKGASLTIRSGSVSGQTMTLELTEDAASFNVTAIVPVRKRSTPSAKTVNRKVVARINCSTNVAGLNGPWCLGASDVIRLRGVYKGSTTTFTAVTNGVTDVTNDFYIDSNHNPDYVGLGYLYQRSGSKLQLTSADRLLAVFDVLTGSGSGLRTINSYPIDDSKTLEASTTTINTLELPEVFGQQNSYYDVRDAFDFRPMWTNQLTLQTAQSTAPINPVEPGYNSRYSSVGPFPAPQTAITCDVEFYLPRIDRVVVNSKGEFVVLEGTPGTNVAPEEPQDVITINALNVPQYPSIPYAISDDLATIADTRIANESVARVRLNRFRINTILTTEEILAEQPKGYRMTDIGDLDRRLQNVEYYLGLTMAEAAASARAIPSSTNPNIDRFKFGYFVDSFSDSSLAELSHPQYNASIAEGTLRPKTENLVVKLDTPTENTTAGVATLPFDNFVLVEQLGATTGELIPPVPAPPAPPVLPTGDGTVVVNPPPAPVDDIVTLPPAPVPPAVVSQTMTSIFVANQNTYKDQLGTYFEEQEVFLSSLPGQCELYFKFRDNHNAIEIFQGHTPGFEVSGSPIIDGQQAVSYDETDIAAGQYNDMYTGTEPLVHIGWEDGHYLVEDMGKLIFNFNPALGRYLKIRVYKYRKSGQANNWSGRFYYRFYFPVDTVTSTVTTTVPSTFNYQGVVYNVSPPSFNVGSATNSDGSTSYYNESQLFTITVTGLKPNTVHGFTFDDVDYTPVVKNIDTNEFGVIRTNSLGVASFSFTYTGMNGTSTFTQAAALASAQPSLKLFTIQSADASSTAAGQISAPGYAQTQVVVPRDPIIVERTTYPGTFSRFSRDEPINFHQL